VTIITGDILTRDKIKATIHIIKTLIIIKEGTTPQATIKDMEEVIIVTTNMEEIKTVINTEKMEMMIAFRRHVQFALRCYAAAVYVM